MPIEHKSSPDSQQEVGLTQASSTDIQHTQESEDTGNKLRKINDILGPFEFTDDQEDKYTKSLLQLNYDQLAIVQRLDKNAFEDLLNKPQAEVLQFLIQAQIDELDKSDDPDFDKLEALQIQLIAVENQKQEKQQKTIATEKLETQDQNKLIEAKLKAQDAQIAGLRGALLENAALEKNAKIGSLRKMISHAESTAQDRDGLNTKGKELLQGDIQDELKKIGEYLQSPGNLESIAKDLGGTQTKEYIEFKSQMLAIEGLDLQASFDRVEAGTLGELAKVKLGVDNLDGVNLDDDILTKTQGDLTIEASKDNRNLSLEGSNYKLPSKLDSKYEDQIEGLNQKSMKELAPYNEKLTLLSGVLSFLKTAQEKGVRFEEAKTHIQQKHPETYNSLGLSGKQSYIKMTSAIQAHMTQLEDSKKKIIKKTTKKLEQITAQNKKEAQEKDRAVEGMLRFLNSIGVDEIDQDKLAQIIDIVNLNHASYGLQQPIDLENGSLGFDLDFGNKAISFLEKKAFIGFINKMLGEQIINEDIASGTTTLQPDSLNRIRALNNNISGYFIANLNKQDI